MTASGAKKPRSYQLRRSAEKVVGVVIAVPLVLGMVGAAWALKLLRRR